MLPYWLLFSLWAAGAVQAERRSERDSRLYFFIPAALLTTLMIGFRNEVGGDWGAYQRIFEDIYFLSLPAAMETTDPGYAALNWLAVQFGFGISFVNLVCGALFMTGVARLAWRQPNPALAILVAVPYLIIVVAMGYTRQAAAIGLICFAVSDASEERLIKLVVLISLAALFHKTAILILPLALVPVLRRNILFGMIGGVFFVILSITFLGDSSDRLISNYVDGNYDSQGAAIRVAMTVVPGILFILFRSKMEMPPFQKSFWMVCSVISILLVAALTISSASSGVDRMSLYFIPLQFILYSRIPYVFTSTGKALPSVLFAVIFYCLLVQFVWLNFADNANYWLPYSTTLMEDGR